MAFIGVGLGDGLQIQRLGRKNVKRDMYSKLRITLKLW
jgi:hypothetical protein